jgi:carboxypeptidase family protein
LPFWLTTMTPPGIVSFGNSSTYAWPDPCELPRPMANEENGQAILSDSISDTTVDVAGTAAQSWMGVVLSTPLSRVQAVVGVLAGCLTIVGTLVSYTGLSKPPVPVQGELVALVQLANNRRPLPSATVEILTAQDAIVTTLNPQADGRITRKLKEGRYRVRVTHPNLMTETRSVEVFAGQQSQVRLALVPRPVARPARAVANVTVVEQPGGVRKFFKELGF